jgi:hypothetical protein
MDCKFFITCCDKKNTCHDFRLLLLFEFGLDFLTNYFENIHCHYTCFEYHCNPKLGYINFWVSLIREVGCWLVEPFVSMMAAFTLLPHGKLC